MTQEFEKTRRPSILQLPRPKFDTVNWQSLPATKRDSQTPDRFTGDLTPIDAPPKAHLYPQPSTPVDVLDDAQLDLEGGVIAGTSNPDDEMFSKRPGGPSAPLIGGGGDTRHTSYGVVSSSSPDNSPDPSFGPTSPTLTTRSAGGLGVQASGRAIGFTESVSSRGKERSGPVGGNGDDDQGEDQTDSLENNGNTEHGSSKRRWRPNLGINLNLNPALVLENSGSVARDHLAAERTFLAYVRTSLAVSSTGVALVQLFRISVKTATSPSPIASRLQQFARPLGATTVLMGFFVLLIGFTRYFRIQTALIKGFFPPAHQTITFMSTVLALLVATVFGILVAVPR